MSLNDLLEHEDKRVTSMGAAFIGERVVFRGKDLHHELRDLSWMELYLYGITGRYFSEKQVKVLNFMWVSTSYPEPSIWCNRIIALAGSARSTASLAHAAGIGVSEAKLYGGISEIKAAYFLIRAKTAIDRGQKLPEFVEREHRTNKTIDGYGRPIARNDERIPHMMKLLKELRLNNGTYVRLAFDIENILRSKRRQFGCMNAAGIYSAILIDFGLTEREIYQFLVPCFIAGMMPCFIEASEKPEGSFFPLRCDRLVYKGTSRRKW